MAVINSGDQRTWNNGGICTIGADTVANIAEGTLEIDDRHREIMIQRDRGELTDKPIPGNRNPATIKLTLKVARIAGATSPLAAIYGALSSGHIVGVDAADGTVQVFTLDIQIPAYKGASTGDRIKTTAAYATKGPKWKSGGGSGENFDTLELELASCQAIAYTTY